MQGGFPCLGAPSSGIAAPPTDHAGETIVRVNDEHPKEHRMRNRTKVAYLAGRHGGDGGGGWVKERSCLAATQTSRKSDSSLLPSGVIERVKWVTQTDLAA
ncbi:hypothetical protein E2C01_011402 [Portunus trituberculatus]|uniref:Uncharacterized protein n=1 Tax=Portunus trituberculatus TaxID=210409 RepID=A0A5B7DBL9_PORTR|nr:hypothetical protein [Portunus trituberculatus]